MDKYMIKLILKNYLYSVCSVTRMQFNKKNYFTPFYLKVKVTNILKTNSYTPPCIKQVNRRLLMAIVFFNKNILSLQEK